MPARTHAPRKHHARRREAGAAMLIVMMVLLVATTISSMAIEMITLETRSAGYYRQQAQTHYVADSAMTAMLSINSAIMGGKLCRSAQDWTKPAETPNPNNLELLINYGEPNPGFVRPGGTLPVHRMEQGELTGEIFKDPAGRPAVMQGPGESLGVQGFAPWYTVDFTDFHVEPSATPGTDASGNAKQTINIRTTVTVRGRLWAADAFGIPLAAGARGASRTVNGQILQEYTDSAYDTRAVVRFENIGGDCAQ